METAKIANGSTVQVATRKRVVKSPIRMAFERFFNNKLAVASVIVLCLIIFMTVAAPLFTHQSPIQQHLLNTDAPPSAQHLLGTNDAGVDYLAMDLYGGRTDLQIGFFATIFIFFISLVLGGTAGYYGGWVDSALMRIVDFMLNFPFLLLIIILEAIIQKTSVWLLIMVMSVTGWPGVTRYIRGLFLNLREAEYVIAAKIAGIGTWRIILKHMMPNVLGPLVVQWTFMIAGNVFFEAVLAIIGFGVPPTIPSWGNTLNGAISYFTLKDAPWAWLPPAGLLTLTILCINFIGDGLRDAFDPSFEH